MARDSVGADGHDGVGRRILSTHGLGLVPKGAGDSVDAWRQVILVWPAPLGTLLGDLVGSGAKRTLDGARTREVVCRLTGTRRRTSGTSITVGVPNGPGVDLT